MPLGSLPFKYLGVPISHKKLTYSQCLPLVEKISSRIVQWLSKFLSYAVRVVLIKSVLNGFKSYWTQIFLLPKKVVKSLRAYVENFCGVELI